MIRVHLEIQRSAPPPSSLSLSLTNILALKAIHEEMQRGEAVSEGLPPSSSSHGQQGDRQDPNDVCRGFHPSPPLASGYLDTLRQCPLT